MEYSLPVIEGMYLFFAHQDDDLLDFPAISAWNIPCAYM